jgi:hypothetical protein
MFKIFVSHSNVDRPLVDALRDLIRGTFSEPVEVMYSSASVASGGISAGQSWLDWVLKQIHQSKMTIVVLTPLSKARPWLMWEAGAVTGVGLSQGSSIPIVPLLFGIGTEDVPSPLRDRQLKIGTSKEQILDLLESLRQLGDLTYRPSELRVELVKTYIETVKGNHIPGMYDLFISCPMAAFKDAEFDHFRVLIDSLLESIPKGKYSIYCAMLNNRARQNFDPAAIAAEGDLNALKQSRNFLMIYPKKIVSSCLLEAGYALITGMQSTYFVRNDDDLPYMLRGAVESFKNVRRFHFTESNEIKERFDRYQDKIISGLQ